MGSERISVPESARRRTAKFVRPYLLPRQAFDIPDDTAVHTPLSRTRSCGGVAGFDRPGRYPSNPLHITKRYRYPTPECALGSRDVVGQRVIHLLVS